MRLASHSGSAWVPIWSRASTASCQKLFADGSSLQAVSIGDESSFKRDRIVCRDLPHHLDQTRLGVRPTFVEHWGGRWVLLH